MLSKRDQVCLLLGIFTSFSYGLRDPFNIVHEFKVIDFEYPSAEARQADIDNGDFIHRMAFDVDVWYNKKNEKPTIFVAIPRYIGKVPASLGVVVPNEHGESIIRPYPSWDWYNNSSGCNKNRILSVFRIQIDECDRLWVLDVGAIGEINVTCPPQILAFDLHTNKVVVKYELPSNQYRKNSAFVTPIVDVINKRNKCANTFVYAADCKGNALVVYDNANNDSWLVKDDTMTPDPNYSNYSIAGINFTAIDGIADMALTPRNVDGSKRLYYHAMSSGSEHYIKTSNLHNKTLFTNNNSYSNLFHTYNGSRWTQSAAEAIDSNGILYFGLHTNISLACFNTSGEYGIPGNDSDVVADNHKTLQFISGIKVKRDTFGKEYIWLVSCRYQKVVTGTLNTNETNFRIQVARTDDVKKGTNCARHH